MNLILSDELKLPLEAVTRTFSILAMKGVGKTHCGVVMTEEMLKAGQTVIVIDPVGVWWGLRSSKDGRSEGHSVVIFGGEHGDAPLEETAGETIASAIVQNQFSAILDLSQMRKGAQVRLMTAFAESLYRLNRRPLHLMVDEADSFAAQRPMKGEERLLGSFEDIVRRGRARGLGVTLITQRAAVINKNVLSVASWMRVPLWQGWRGKCLRTLEELWEQAACHHPIEKHRRYECVQFSTKSNSLKTICWQNGMGQWAPIAKIIRHWYVGPMVRLCQKWGEICVTPNHSVYGAGGQLAKPQDNPELLAVRFLNQQHARDKCRITLDIPSTCQRRRQWIVPRFKGARSKLRTKLYAGKLVAFLHFLGAWLAEGSAHLSLDGSYIIQIANQNKRWLEKLKGDIHKFIGPGSVHILRSSTPGTWNLSLSHKVLFKWLKRNAGDGSRTKRFPDFIFQLSRKHVEHLITNMVLGDGQRKDNQLWNYFSNSPELIQGLGFLCNLHGWGFTIHKNETTGVYKLSRQDWYKPTSVSARTKQIINYEGWVYDLEIADGYAHNFTVGIGHAVVHNTQTEVLVCLRVMAPQDREAVEAWIEAHGTEKEKESFTNSLASLKRGQAWFWSPGWLDLFKLVQIRDRETFDSSATPKVGQVASKPRKLSRVDIARLGQQIQATVEKAKENDPAELRRQIAALKKDLAQQPAAKPVATKIEKVSIFHEGDRKLIHKALDASKAAENAVGATLKGLRSIYEGLEKLLSKAAQASAIPATPPIKKPWSPPARRDPLPRTVSILQRADQENGVPPPGELKILRAVAQHAEGTSRDQLTVLTGYRKSSRDTYVSKLFGKGLIAFGPDGQLHATTEGLKILGPGFEPLPTGEALREYWLNHLPPGEKRIFECILGDYPNPISRELISEQTGYLKSSRDTYLSKLASRKLIEVQRAGMVVASRKLFE